MAIYTIDYTTTATMISSLEAALTTAGIVDTVHYNTSPNLIVTLTRCSRVIKFNIPTSYRWYVYHGSSYASGANINDQQIVHANAAGTGASSYLVVTGDIVALVEYRGAVGLIYAAIIGTMNNVGADEVILGHSRWGDSNGYCWDVERGSGLELVGVRGPAISGDNKYYQTDIPCLDAAYKERATGITGLKYLLRAPVLSAAYEAAGDDIIVGGGGANGDSFYFPCCFLIEDASVWAPA